MNLRRVLLVAVGGTVGTAARLALGLLIPEDGGFPTAILIANLVGALLIGVLAARPSGRLGGAAAAEVRLLLGTGMLGGFTTYSAFMTGTLALWADAPIVAVAYALGSLVLGLGAAALGLRIGRPRGRGQVPA